jgi:hypothetical protein
MRRGSGIGIVVAAVFALALVGFVVTREERREASTVEPRPHARPTAPRHAEPPDVEPAPEPGGHGASEPEPSEPEPSDPEAPRHRRGYRAFRATNPPGVLEVLVLLAHEPLVDATVRVRATRRGELFESAVPADDERVAFTDEHGLARFEPLPADYYMIGVQTDEGVLVTTYRLLRAERQTPRQIVALGRGGLTGQVHAIDGRPVGRSRVLIGIDPPAGAARVSAVATTELDGSYKIAGLSEGRGRVYSQLGRSIEVELARDEWKRADFGSSSTPVAWRGALRSASGLACEGFKSLLACDTSDGESYAIDVDSSGGFDTRLPPGSYRVCTAGEATLELGVVELAVQPTGNKLEHDLLVPGVMIVGRVTAAEEGIEGAVEITITREGAPESRRTYPARVGGHYSFAGLEAGKWFVDAQPLKLLGARAHGLEVTLNAARDKTTLDLLVSAN